MTDTSRLQSSALDLMAEATHGGAAPGISVAILVGNEPAVIAAEGLASVELGVEATPDNVFPIASITKILTAVLVMEAAQDGLLSLDAPIRDLLRALPAAWDGPTIREALAHVSGLPDMIVDPMRGKWLAQTREEAIAAAGALPLQFPAGSDWSYNQTNYVLLGWIMERVYDARFDDIVKDRILEPLFLSSTTFGDSSSVVPGRGPWYSRIDFSGPEPRLAEVVCQSWVTYPPFAHPCAGLNTTAAELARVVSAVASGELLTSETRDEMWSPHHLRDGRRAAADPETSFALGWMVEDLDGVTLVGGTGGATSAFRHAVTPAATVVVLTNCQGSNPDGLATKMMRLVLSG